MAQELNPFADLYFTEGASPDEFVDIFSPALIDMAISLFQRGNVILRGTQGSGKTMLLNLMKPEVRIAFAKKKRPYPVPKNCGRFLGLGISLLRSRAFEIGQMEIPGLGSASRDQFHLVFADFVNYLILEDIIASLKCVCDHPEAFDFKLNSDRLPAFAARFAQQECFFGYLADCQDLNSLERRIRDRITAYRSFHLGNSDDIPAEILRSKTRIGEPIAQVASLVSETCLSESDISFYIRVDEYDQLQRVTHLDRDVVGRYEQVFFEALNRRDRNVSFKIGTRPYGWKLDSRVFRSGQEPEKGRNYKVLDIELDLLRRKENTQKAVFSRFANDVFERRLKVVGFRVKPKEGLKSVFGHSPTSVEKMERYASTSKPEAFLALDLPGWNPAWQKFLRSLCAKGVPGKLEAKLAQTWALQTGGRSAAQGYRMAAKPPPSEGAPWNRQYWRKERVRQALIQVAGKCRQRPIWAGYEEILGLTNGSILIFLSVCQFIWDGYYRVGAPSVSSKKELPPTPIPVPVQTAAIYDASASWLDKVNEWPNGPERRRFLEGLGRLFSSRLTEDIAMSNPGHNGFSVVVDECDADAEVKKFLQDAVEFGSLFEYEHTTKETRKRKRIKFYMNPVFSPYFRIPETHVKEPIYVGIDDVKRWIEKARKNEPDFDSRAVGLQIPLAL